MRLIPKLLLLAIASITLVSSDLRAQNNASPVTATSPITNAVAVPSFDVATIKPFHLGPQAFIGIANTPDGIHASGASLAMLMVYAYSLRTEDQVVGVPDWAKTERFDVQAKMNAEDTVEIQKLSSAEKSARRASMLQALLAERFKLKIHRETKELPVYELVVFKDLSKLKDAATDPNLPLGKGADGKPSTGIRFLKDTSIVQAQSMTSLAGFLSQSVAGVGRPVLDKTGLTGTYDFTLNWSVYSNGAGSAPGSPEDNRASIFPALQEVGLKLQPARGPIDMIVIDHVEQPSEN